MNKYKWNPSGALNALFSIIGIYTHDLASLWIPRPSRTVFLSHSSCTEYTLKNVEWICMLLRGAPKCWEILEKSRVMCFRESFWRLSGLTMRERMAWQRGKVEGRKSSRVMSKSKHLHPHSGSSRTCSSVKKKKKNYLLIFGPGEASLLHWAFLYLQWVGATLSLRCIGFSL